MFKSLVIRLFLNKEVSALKSRLAEASDALKRIEADMVAIDKNASAEVHALAAKVITRVLGSADQVRIKETGYVHAWEASAYRIYLAGKNSAEATLGYAHKLLDETKVFFKK